MEKYTVFIDQKDQYGENQYTITIYNLNPIIYCFSIYRFNAIPVKLPTLFFKRTRTNNFTICMEIQKTLNSQSNLEKEEWN